jgi:hypothetical protein
MNSMTVRSNQNRPDFADAEKLFLLFKYPWGLRPPRAMMEAIFVLPQVPPGTPAPRDERRLPSPPKMVRASYSAGCKASLRLSALTPANSRLWDLIVEALREWVDGERTRGKRR